MFAFSISGTRFRPEEWGFQAASEEVWAAFLWHASQKLVHFLKPMVKHGRKKGSQRSRTLRGLEQFLDQVKSNTITVATTEMRENSDLALKVYTGAFGLEVPKSPSSPYQFVLQWKEKLCQLWSKLFTEDQSEVKMLEMKQLAIGAAIDLIQYGRSELNKSSSQLKKLEKFALELFCVGSRVQLEFESFQSNRLVVMPAGGSANSGMWRKIQHLTLWLEAFKKTQISLGTNSGSAEAGFALVAEISRLPWNVDQGLKNAMEQCANQFYVGVTSLQPESLSAHYIRFYLEFSTEMVLVTTLISIMIGALFLSNNGDRWSWTNAALIALPAIVASAIMAIAHLIGRSITVEPD
jgi:hypothetical protein